MPTVHIRQDTARAAERDSELGELVLLLPASSHLASAAFTPEAVFCVQIKGHEASQEASTGALSS